MENSPDPMLLERRGRARWLRVSHILCFFLGVIVVFALRLHGSFFSQRVMKANAALAEAYLPNLPSSARELSFLHEGLLFGERYMIAFQSNTVDIHAWTNGFTRAPEFDDAVVAKTGLIKYELTHFAWGNRSCGSVIIDEKSRAVYVNLEFINCSL